MGRAFLWRGVWQGEEACCICLVNPVEVKFKPCNHDVCLDCCNRMRAANVFKARGSREELGGIQPNCAANCGGVGVGGEPLRGWAALYSERRPSAYGCATLHQDPCAPPWYSFVLVQADAGIKCAMCRQYIEVYTDLNG